jgi:hypothetical protein
LPKPLSKFSFRHSGSCCRSFDSICQQAATPSGITIPASSEASLLADSITSGFVFACQIRNWQSICNHQKQKIRPAFSRLQELEDEYVDCQTCIATALYLHRSGAVDSDRGTAGHRAHSQGHLSQHQYPRRQRERFRRVSPASVRC